jgi:PAS domain S-box-containing protein
MQKLDPKLPRQFPLRVVLIGAVIGQLLAAIGLVGYLSFRNGQKAVNDLASQLRRELTARIEQELHSYFATPHEINRLNADAFARGDLDVVTAKRGESQLYQQMVVAPTVAFVYCGSENSGEFFGVLRSPKDGTLQLTYGNQSNSYLRAFYALDVAGDRSFFLRRATKRFDARQRPWYKRAVAAERPVWTDVYIAFTTGLPNVTAATPVYDRSGQRLLGACGTDVVLPKEFRSFLQKLEIGKNGQAFVIDRQGNLISDSTNEPLMVGEGDNAKSMPAIDSKAPLVSGTAKYLLQQFSSFSSITQSQQLEFQLLEQRQYLQVVPFRDRYGLDWLIAVVVPEADFMAQINANTRNTILLCLATAGLAVAVGIFTSRWITHPILRVSQASDKLAQGDLTQRIAASPIAEIGTLATSFNRMAGQLQASFEALSYSEARNRALLNAIPDLMLEISAEGVYLDSLEAKSGRWMQIQPRDWVGKHVRDTMPESIANQYTQAIQTVLKTGVPQTLEYQLPVDSEIQTFEARVVRCNPKSTLFIVRNISDRKRAEEALRIAEENYRSIFENALEGIFQSSPEGRFISVNPALAKIYGYNSPVEMMSSITNIAEQLYVDPEKRTEFKTLLDRENTVEGFEYRCYCKDGSIIWTQIDARVVRDDQGKVMYYEGIVQDITERRHMETELRRQLEVLKIEIDQQKREQEVATLTASSYFQEVKQEIARVNLDEFWR